MTEPYRPLFVELADDLFAIAKGVVEQAVKVAQRPTPPFKPGPWTLLQDALAGDSFNRKISERFDWARITQVIRREASCDVDFTVWHHCGHAQLLTIEERAAHTGINAFLGIADALDLERERTPRACYCTPRRMP